ncbi:MAG: cytochrome c biogenesis protein CcdA [Chloroflexota bacterium]|nr:cytochrome c biogenesis protein CcdA [Chloroflexota bacterium]
MDIGIIGFLGAFGAGVLSFVSPCVFPLIPAYLAQITGMSFDELTGDHDAKQRRTLLVNTFAFVFGLALVFTLFGASATLLGRFLINNQTLVERIAGMIIIVFGLHMMTVIRIPWLMREARVDMNDARKQAAGPAGSALMGGAFAVGWTPCIGPVLASILAIASQADTVVVGMGLLLVYALGLGVPFIIMALLINRAAGKRTIAGIRRYLPQLTMVSGVLLVTMGLLVFSGNLIRLSNWITATFGTGFTL